MSTPTLPQRPEVVVSHFWQFKAPRGSGRQPGWETKVPFVGLLVGLLNPDCVISAPVCVIRGLLGHHAARCEEHSVWFCRDYPESWQQMPSVWHINKTQPRWYNPTPDAPQKPSVLHIKPAVGVLRSSICYSQKYAKTLKMVQKVQSVMLAPHPQRTPYWWLSGSSAVVLVC